MSSPNQSMETSRSTTHFEALRHPRTLLSIAMLLFFSTMVWIALDYPWQAQMLPLVIGIPAIALSALQIYLDVANYHKSEGKIDPRTAFEIYMDEITANTKGQVKMELGAERKELTTLVEDPSTIGRTRGQRERLLFAYFYGLVIVVLLFGFWIGVPAFLITFLRFYAREGWKLIASLTLAAWGLMYLLLVVFLEQVLFEGFITGYVMDMFAPS